MVSSQLKRDLREEHLNNDDIFKGVTKFLRIWKIGPMYLLDVLIGFRDKYTSL